MITLYALDLDDTDDAAFYEYLLNVEINIISTNQEIYRNSAVETGIEKVIAFVCLNGFAV